MRTEQYIDEVGYQSDEPESSSQQHKLAIEIVARLQELDEIKGSGAVPYGVQLIRRLTLVERKSRRAYRLLLDVLSQQRSLSDSLQELAARHQNAEGNPCSRQSWLQNMQADVALISIVMPELGKALTEVMERRGWEGEK